jgi:cobalt transporter subunit CbtB
MQRSRTRRGDFVSHAESVMPTAQSPASHPSSAASAQRISATAPAALAILFGLLIVGLTGFSHLEVIHNAAHDTRHSNAFPCH